MPTTLTLPGEALGVFIEDEVNATSLRHSDAAVQVTKVDAYTRHGGCLGRARETQGRKQEVECV